MFHSTIHKQILAFGYRGAERKKVKYMFSYGYIGEVLWLQSITNILDFYNRTPLSMQMSPQQVFKAITGTFSWSSLLSWTWSISVLNGKCVYFLTCLFFISSSSPFPGRRNKSKFFLFFFFLIWAETKI